MRKSLSSVRRTVRGLVVPASGARRHLAPGLTLDEFFAELKAHDVCYVVLRWFETLPAVDAGEDIDLLVADEDLAFVRTLMTTRSGPQPTQKFDIYSVSGLPGSDFHGVPYYPPRFAREVLDGGTWLRDRYRVPSLQHHHDSLAYHAVYHKGHASGLSTGSIPAEVRQPTDHDYEAVLTELARRLGRPLHPTLESLDRHLAAVDLRPPLDTLERLEPTNPWIHDHFFAGQPTVDELWRGLAVFVLRDRAKAQVDEAVQALDREGFEILDVVQLDLEQRSRASHRLRGGNWAQGPWPLSGGSPATFVVAYDVAPDIDGSDADRHNNLRIPRAKEQLRARLLTGVTAAEQYNPVHSSDNPRQALDYLEVLDHTYTEQTLRPVVEQLVATVQFPYPVVRRLPGSARRAQVAVVEHPVHGPSVCKLFRPGAARFLERELRGREELGHLPELPDLLERGENWAVTTLYADDRSHRRRMLPGREDAQLTRDASQRLVELARQLHHRGLFLLDLSTHNLMTDPVDGLKVLDLEFLHEYWGPVPALRDSYTFRGVAPGVPGYDVPKPTELTIGVGGSAFHPAITGASIDALLRPDRPLDAQRRVLVQSGWYGRFMVRRLRRATRTAVGASRVGRDVSTLLRGLSRRIGRR